ncbi:MAG: hypothetical protein L6263_10605 [Desulfobacteraceae bacterium]|nr:hypothetical protein [Desulfobacteraceae bacterium]
MNGLKILTRLPRKLGERAGAWQLARELARKVYRLLRFRVHGSGLESYEIRIEPLFHQFNREP